MMSNANADEGAAREPRVLVIDDDALVGKAIGRVLRPFRVTFAQSATGALARIQAGGDFQAIVCDLFMPGMNGMQFHQELTSFAPPLASRIVFLTGNRGARGRLLPPAHRQRLPRQALRSRRPQGGRLGREVGCAAAAGRGHEPDPQLRPRPGRELIERSSGLHIGALGLLGVHAAQPRRTGACPLNLVGTRSTASPSFRQKHRDAGGTRP